MRRLALTTTLLLLAGCGGYKKDVETICNVRTLVSVPAGADAAKQESVLSEYLSTNIHSPKARKMFATLGSLTPVEKAKVLRKEASKEGVAPCPLADEFDPEGKAAK